MSAEPGGLTIMIDDDRVEISADDGSVWQLPLGPVTLLDRELERVDPPGPAQLANALATVGDHFDDVIMAEPSVLDASSAVAVGAHAVVLARVEVGGDSVPSGYRLRRTDAEDVFRTIVAEPVEDRRFNPGLPTTHVETVVGTCCVILAIMRRLDLPEIAIAVDTVVDAGPGC